jgi:hypothetical protein
MLTFQNIMKDILNNINNSNTNTKIIFCGDPCQLPPVNEENNIMEYLVRELMIQNQQQLLLHKETLQQNQELQKQVIELCKSGTHNTINTNTNTRSNPFS